MASCLDMRTTRGTGKTEFETANAGMEEVLLGQAMAYAQFRGWEPGESSRFDLTALDEIDDSDASRFLRALELDLVRPCDDGGFLFVGARRRMKIFSLRRSRGGEVRAVPSAARIITIGALAWLHEELGWPRDLLVPEEERGDFLLSCRKPASLTWLVRCDVRVTPDDGREVVEVLSNPAGRLPGRFASSSRRKMQTLWAAPSAFFCSIGPGGDRRVFRMAENTDTLEYVESTVDDLRYPSACSTSS